VERSQGRTIPLMAGGGEEEAQLHWLWRSNLPLSVNCTGSEEKSEKGVGRRRKGGREKRGKSIRGEKKIVGGKERKM